MDHTLDHNALVRAIQEYCAWCHAWTLKVHGGMYQRPGIPDLLVCFPRSWDSARFLAIEVKTGTARLTRRQEDELAALSHAGALTVVVGTIEEFEEFLIKHELVKESRLASL